MVAVKNVYSSSANAFYNGLNTLGSGAKKGFHLVCLSKPQNTLGRHVVQTARVLYLARVIATLVAIGVHQYRQPKDQRDSLIEVTKFSALSFFPGVGIYLLRDNVEDILNPKKFSQPRGIR